MKLILFSIAIVFLINYQVSANGPANLTACSYKSDFISSEGSYLKSVCQIHVHSGYEKAEAKCIENGMRLFVINNAVVQKALKQYADKIWARGSGAELWINGKKGDDNKWYTNTSKVSLFAGSVERKVMADANCLCVSNVRDLFIVETINCNAWITPFCEYSIYKWRKLD